MVSHRATDDAQAADELTVDELAARAGTSVRTVRFYAGKRLLPPPRLVGRTGYYGPSHLARLALIRDLTDAGYTLAAVQDFLGSLPADADAEAVSLYGALLTPWAGRDTIVLTRDELVTRAGRPIDDDALALLAGSGALEVRSDGRIALSEGQLELALRLLDLDAPLDALLEAGDIVRQHAAALARDLQRLFRERIIAELGDADPAARERLRALAAALRPLTIQALIAAYTEALEREVRGAARR
jgi:DNA-binding transcriptional MerR regulator